jgi:hypothetical protein
VFVRRGESSRMCLCGRGFLLSVFIALTVTAVQSDENGMYLSGICKHSSLKCCLKAKINLCYIGRCRSSSYGILRGNKRTVGRR